MSNLGSPFDIYATTGETANEINADDEHTYVPQGWHLEIDNGPSPDDRIAELEAQLETAERLVVDERAELCKQLDDANRKRETVVCIKRIVDEYKLSRNNAPYYMSRVVVIMDILEATGDNEAEARIAELQRNLAQANDAMLAAMQSKAELEHERNQWQDRAGKATAEMHRAMERMVALVRECDAANSNRQTYFNLAVHKNREIASVRGYIAGIENENVQLRIERDRAEYCRWHWREFAIACNLNRREWREEAVEALEDMVGQACYEEVHNGVQLYSTLCLSTYEYAIRKLCELGIMRLYSEQPQRYCFVEKAVNIPRQIVIGDSEADLATDDGGHSAD